MANFSKIQVPSNLSNLSTLPDIIRYFSAFASQVADSFNGLAAQKSVWGTIGFTGTVVTGVTTSFGASFVGTGLYYIAFRQPFGRQPAVTLGPWSLNGINFGEISGASTTGFSVRTTDNLGNAANVQFSFIAMGAG